MNIRRFVKDRDDALLSLDKEKIMAYMKKYNIHAMPADESVFWFGVHKAIVEINSATEEQKQVSRNWINNFYLGDTP